MLVIVTERQVEKDRAHTNQRRDCHRRNASSNCLQQQGRLNSPFPVSPSGGKPGRAGYPRAAGTLCASKKRWHTSMPRLPPQKGFQSAPLKPPLRIPPMGTGAVSQWTASICGIGAGEKIKDGRHVGLDFYDLLIEAFTDASARPWALRSSDGPDCTAAWPI